MPYCINFESHIVLMWNGFPKHELFIMPKGKKMQQGHSEMPEIVKMQKK